MAAEKMITVSPADLQSAAQEMTKVSEEIKPIIAKLDNIVLQDMADVWGAESYNQYAERYTNECKKVLDDFYAIVLEYTALVQGAATRYQATLEATDTMINSTRA